MQQDREERERLRILQASTSAAVALPDPVPVEAEKPAEDFWQFFARVNPKLLPPRHFARYAERVLDAVGADSRLVFAAPPQHGKTEITLALIAWLVIKNPGKRWAYITYSQKRANSVSRKFKQLMATAGVVTGGTLAQTLLPQGGQILFTSIDGGITGEPVDAAAFIDDPYKNRKEADSASRRATVDDTYREAIEPRIHPGASLFILATRWHPQDLSGTLVDEGAEYINLPAIAEGVANDNGVVIDDPNGRKVGEALFPEKWPVEALLKKKAKVLEFAWSALYQGRPRPKGGKVYYGATYYTKLPEKFRGGYGVDLAFTAKTSADWSVCVELRREEAQTKDGKPFYYVAWVDRDQVEAPDFGLTLRARHVKRKTWNMYWRASGTEKGSASFLQRQGLPIVVSHPPGDKLVCATAAAAAWNEGRILVPDPEVFPECEEWLYPFLDILQNFTGLGKEHDDDSDALANIFDALEAEGGETVPGKQETYESPLRDW